MFLTLWATPRSTSTAFEWMMRQRGDFACHHEPWNELYYYGEDRVSDRDAHVEAKPGHNYSAIWQELSDGGRTGHVFVKDFVYSVEHTLTDEMLARSPIRSSFVIRSGSCRGWPSTGRIAAGTKSASNHCTGSSIASPTATAPRHP